MTQKEQKATVAKFKSGEYNILLCTSIAEEGMRVYVYECVFTVK
jgi:ATP-dependent DNA helicase MPH1